MIEPQKGSDPEKGKEKRIKKVKFKVASESLKEYIDLRAAFIKKYNLNWQIWEIA